MYTSKSDPATTVKPTRYRGLRAAWLIGLVIAMAMLAVITVPAAAQDSSAQSDGTDGQSLFVEPPTVGIEGFVDVSGTCGSDAANTMISIGLGGDLDTGIGTNIVGTNIETDDDGDFQTTVLLPDDVPTGDGFMYATCGQPSERTPAAPLTIVGEVGGPIDSTPFLDVAPVVATRGATIEAVGGCGLDGANSVISIVVGSDVDEGTVVQDVPTDPGGRFSGTFEFPAQGPTGEVAVTAACPGTSDHVPSATLTIVDSDDGDQDEQFLSVEPERSFVGGLIEVAGSCGPDAADSSISLLLGGGVEGGTIATDIDTDADGDFQASVLLPDDGPAGEAELIAACGPGTGAAPTAPLTIVELDDGDDDDGDDGDGDDGDGDDGDDEEPSVLDFGDTGPLVEQWQDLLDEWLALSGSDLALRVDGIFGPRTELATLRFQDATDSIASDGDVDTADRVALRDAIDELESDDSPDRSTVVARGDTGRLVELWQDRLNDWLALSGSDLALRVDGIFGPRTEQATLRFQVATASVSADGVVDPVDRVALRNAIEALESDDSPDDSPDDDEPIPETQVGVYFLSDDVLVVGERDVPNNRRVDVALRELIDGPAAGFEADLGWSSAVPSDTRIRSLVVTPLRAYAEFSQEFSATADPAAAVAQIVFTLTQSPDIDSVDIRVGGEPLEIEDIGSTLGLSRETFTELPFASDPMPLILVESPRVGADVDSSFTLSGISNTFEANVRYQITDPNGVIVIDEATTATAGTGTWGTFEETITLPAFDRDGVASVIVFEESARDGSPTNVVEVPVFVEGRS